MDIKLITELVTSKNFTWMPGMRTLCGQRLRMGWSLNTWLPEQLKVKEIYIDIHDAATKGCLLHITRTLNDPSAFVMCFEEGWQVTTFMDGQEKYFRTEGEALANYIIGYQSPK